MTDDRTTEEYLVTSRAGGPDYHVRWERLP